MSEPSVKGTLLQAALEEIRELEQAGRLERDELLRHLKPEDVELLDAEILPSGWYPIAGYGRLLEATGRALGRGDDAWFVEGGRDAARRLVDLGVYRQLGEHTEERWEDRVGRLLTTLGESLWNFGHWRWLGMDARGFRMEFAGAAPMPRAYALRTRGFIEFLATRAAGAPVSVQMLRSLDGDRLEFHAQRRD